MIDSFRKTVQKQNIDRLLNRHSEIVVFLFLIFMVIIASQLTPLFLKPANLTNIMRQSAALGIVAIGQTFILLLAGIDLSVSSVSTVASVVAAVLMDGKSENILPAVLAGLAVGLVVGFLNGFFITKFKLPDFVVTLAFYSIVNGFMFVFTKGREVGNVAPEFMEFGSINLMKIPITMYIWMGITILSIVFLRFTKFGRNIYEVGGNAESARLSGINVSYVKTITYIISGVMASIGGLVLLTRLGVGYPLAGREMQLDSIIAAVIGGTSLKGGRGNLIGTVAGVLILTSLNNIFNHIGISTFAQIVAKGLIIIIVVILRALNETER
jgi:ribose/xylose/arabinose/galactoside ABC-type transport system permease subunit